MGFKRLRPLLVTGILLCVGLVIAEDTCPAIVETALDAVDALCQDAGRNQACYGNISLTAEAQPGVTNFKFEQDGDIVDVNDISTLKLEALDEAKGTWGLVLMQLQADIPDSLPGQNVTFLLFGNVEIDNAVSDDDSDHTPMQAFYLKTGVSDAPCDEAPDSGLLVQTPEGVETVTFNVNGVDVEVGSTVLFQAQPDDEMIISPVEGSAVVTMDGESYPTIAGTRLRIPMDSDLRPSAPPPLPEVYEARDVAGLPTKLLPREITVQPPLSDDELTQVHDRLNAGELPCGTGDLPDCKGAMKPDALNQPLAPGKEWGDELPPRPERGDNTNLPDGENRPGGDGTPGGNLRPDANSTPDPNQPGENGTPDRNRPGGEGTPGANLTPGGNRPGRDGTPGGSNRPDANTSPDPNQSGGNTPPSGDGGNRPGGQGDGGSDGPPPGGGGGGQGEGGNRPPGG